MSETHEQQAKVQPGQTEGLCHTLVFAGDSPQEICKTAHTWWQCRSKSSRQAVVVSVPIWPEVLQDRQDILKEGNTWRSTSADFSVGYCYFQGFYFSFIVCGAWACSEADFVFFASWVLDVDLAMTWEHKFVSQWVCYVYELTQGKIYSILF